MKFFLKVTNEQTKEKKTHSNALFHGFTLGNMAFRDAEQNLRQTGNTCSWQDFMSYQINLASTH